MKLTLDKEWFQRHVDSEDDAEISAGGFQLDLSPGSSSDAETQPAVPAFGRLINLCRRQRGWTIETLADAARINALEAIRIEHDLGYVPGPRTVYQLSTTLGLPRERMLQLSGNMIVRDNRLGEQAVKFAARSESVEKLNRQEHLALEEFIKYLKESH
jgi:transcriptional regulator with XRE-family HTH domain